MPFLYKEIKMKELDLILIDPYDQSISRVDIDGSLESIYKVSTM